VNSEQLEVVGFQLTCHFDAG